MFAAILGMVFMALGALVPGQIVEILGGDEEIVTVGIPYTRIFMMLYQNTNPNIYIVILKSFKLCT